MIAIEPTASADAHKILQQAISTFTPEKIFALFSGGHDSLCAAHVASTLPGFSGCVHINTGIGIPETSAYVRETCAAFGWPLQEFSPPTSYEVLVSRYGFPGPRMHRVMYHALKERCLRMLVRAQHLEKVCRECGRGSQAHRRLSHAWNPPCILLVSGVRMEESTRRMGHAQAVSRDPADCARVWCAPLLTWRNTEKNVYIEQEGLPRNPVVGKLCMSGECLCGAYAAENEIREIEYWYPAVAERIHALEKQMAVLGKPAKWGTRPKRAQRPEENQADLFSLCWSCGNKPATLQEVSHAS